LTSYDGKDKYGSAITYLSQDYLAAISAAGGVPILLPPGMDEAQCAAAFDRLDGVLFTGGGDIAINRFDGEPHPRVGGVDAARDATELALFHLALDENRPFLGICRGVQLINVGCGGSLYTDLRDQLMGALDHDLFPAFGRDHPAHAVEIEPGTQLANLFGSTSVMVNSMHHQGLKRLGKRVLPAGYSSDGLVEALEIQGHPFGLGVQWHPECLSGQAPMQRLFQAFTQAAKDRR